MNSATKVESKVEIVSENELVIRISNKLCEFGIPRNLKGYRYLRKAILITYHNFEMVNSVTKTIYPSIANTYQDTPSRVERAMRHAIECGYYKNVNQEFPKPKNSEFIAMVADSMRVENGIY
ncbi:sporulation initiation factor Spo0A C-terminal domain-containing protein [Anaerobacillus sp. CMMVII]|uniref:sporulation initiation factor Spo0A C-terminal domain-containing protein n=1 Tax=Anaerobacillus sp. CMMVII TaxID=2755588 RepID=UPI0021B77729|nr:sporulation initiation factor Spo0A C-terminal domain-containing protein [Anaerobacillus sp. CMMVII]MCT8138608.1 sporulation initiation factor Spo0A C-terminal domain-containing protein [Anaerobacillus sp. CMMVII]